MQHIVKDHELYRKTVFGFWVYLMTDSILFSVLFVCYILLHTSNFGGPTTQELYSLRLVFAETMVLLTSSFTIGIARLYAHKQVIGKTLIWLGITFLLGLSFVIMEGTEFTQLVLEGNSWKRSAFLSSYFTLVGTHGIHVSFGLIWIIFTFVLLARRGMNEHNFRRLTTLGIFWHFLDLVWIFLFSIVYLMGAK